MEDKDIEIKPIIIRESEFFGGCIRVKISVKNISSLAILDAALELESDEKILHFDRCEPEYPEKKGKIQLGNINPATDRTIAFYLDPLICAKEGTDLNCRLSYKNAFGKPDSIQMETLKIKVVCPIFRTEQDINIGRLKELVSVHQFHNSKVYTIPETAEVSEILGICNDVVLLHDVRHIKTFKTTDEKAYEAWYYGKTKVTMKDLVIKCAISKDTESIEVFASGNDPSDITGLLAEIGRNLRKEFDKSGKFHPVFNITIKDSIIQRSNLLSFCNLDGSCGGDVVIEDSVVQRSNIAGLNERNERAIEEKHELTPPEPEGTSRKSFFAVALVIGVLVMGYWALAPLSNNASEKLKSNPFPSPEVTSGTVQIPESTPPVSPKPIGLSVDRKTYTNSIGMELVLIPAGEFDMGSPPDERDRYPMEGPLHRVNISNAFYMGKYEVTQKQWRDIMGNDPSGFKGDNLPVESVSWNDSQEFIRKLNDYEGTNKYRLPSEAEWEYAARAGTRTRYSFGDNESELGDYAWYNGNSDFETHEVGLKKPNAWGLYDMHGNVWEWVQDTWHNKYDGAPTDGSAWDGNGSYRVIREGRWYDPARACRSANRNYNEAGYSRDFLGFRLLRTL